MVALGDSEASVRGVMGDGVQLPVLLDPAMKVGGSYEIEAVPTAVFVDAKGRIAEVTIGATTAEELWKAASALK